MFKGSSFVDSSFVNGPNVQASLASGSRFLGSLYASYTQEMHTIGYPDGWGTGETEKWYQAQQSKKFTHLQYRKEREGPFFHEYIVVELASGDLVCRFDRRGDVSTRASAFALQGMKAEDTAHVIVKSDTTFFNDITDNSDLLLRIHFPRGEDLLTILGICYGVQRDDRAKAFTLTRFNCYFLSWTVITATARRTVDWALLSKDNSQWEALVKTTIDGLDNDPAPVSVFNAKTRAFFGRKRRTEPEPVSLFKVKSRAFFGRKRKTEAEPAPTPAPTDHIPFNGTAYLISTLRKALMATRLNIQKSLDELILRTTVQETMRDISHKSAQAAADEAARIYASQAARDAAMEAVIATMWRAILSAENGGQMWEDRCRVTEECVWKASAAAADAATKQQPQTLLVPLTPSSTVPPALSSTLSSAAPLSVPPTPSTASATPSEGDTENPQTPVSTAGSWEDAWDRAWDDSWDVLVKANTKSTNSEASSTSISQRAKKAWGNAWTEACRANEKYVPRIGEGVSKFVIDNLPESLPEVLKIDTNIQSSMRAMVSKAFASDSSNAKLQEWIQQRIQEHCQRVANMQLGLANSASKSEIEEAMRRVWVTTTQLEGQQAQTLELIG